MESCCYLAFKIHLFTHHNSLHENKSSVGSKNDNCTEENGAHTLERE